MTIEEINNLSQANHAHFMSFALSLTRDYDRAKDLLQEVTYQVIKNRNMFQPGTDFPAWVRRIIRNVFISDYRRAKRRTDIIARNRLPAVWHGVSTVPNAGTRRLEEEEVLAVIDLLPDPFRLTFLRYYNGMSYQEIALRSGVPLGTVKSRLFTARGMLKKRLPRLGVSA